MKKTLTVFLCSTYADLAAEREQILRAIRTLQLQHDSMEFFGARAGQAIETCLEEVRRSDLLVVVVGHRYGSLVPRTDVSFSEAEYTEGHRLEKPCLVYLRRDDVPVLPKFVERDPESMRRLERWKDVLRERHTVAEFSNANDLALQVTADISRTVQFLQEAQIQSASTARPPDSGDQNLVFISYSHADAKWLTRLRVHLKPLERHGVIVSWDDTKIKPGTEWREEIRNALERARVAVLLVSADFLASDFIATNELPPLLQAAEAHGTLMLPLILDHCRFEKTEGLSRFQAVNDPSKPLATLDRSHREAWFDKLSRTIEEALMSTSRKPEDDADEKKQSGVIRSVLLDIFPDECRRVGKTNLNDIVKLRGRIQFNPMDGASRLDFAVPLALLVTATAILGHASTIANTWRNSRDTNKLVKDISISLPEGMVGKLEPQILENMLTLFVERLLAGKNDGSED